MESRSGSVRGVAQSDLGHIALGLLRHGRYWCSSILVKFNLTIAGGARRPVVYAGIMIGRARLVPNGEEAGRWLV